MTIYGTNRFLKLSHSAIGYSHLCKGGRKSKSGKIFSPSPLKKVCAIWLYDEMRLICWMGLSIFSGLILIQTSIYWMEDSTRGRTWFAVLLSDIQCFILVLIFTYYSLWKIDHSHTHSSLKKPSSRLVGSKPICFNFFFQPSA